MLILSVVLLWWIGVGFTAGLTTTEDTPLTGYAVIFIGWPVILGEVIKKRLEGTV